MYYGVFRHHVRKYWVGMRHHPCFLVVFVFRLFFLSPSPSGVSCSLMYLPRAPRFLLASIPMLYAQGCRTLGFSSWEHCIV